MKKTAKIKLVETNDIEVSLRRLIGPPYDNWRWRRALYHALAMSCVADVSAVKAVREALGLP